MQVVAPDRNSGTTTASPSSRGSADSNSGCCTSTYISTTCVPGSRSATASTRAVTRALASAERVPWLQATRVVGRGASRLPTAREAAARDAAATGAGVMVGDAAVTVDDAGVTVGGAAVTVDDAGVTTSW